LIIQEIIRERYFSSGTDRFDEIFLMTSLPTYIVLALFLYVFFLEFRLKSNSEIPSDDEFSHLRRITAVLHFVCLSTLAIAYHPFSQEVYSFINCPAFTIAFYLFGIFSSILSLSFLFIRVSKISFKHRTCFQITFISFSFVIVFLSMIETYESFTRSSTCVWVGDWGLISNFGLSALILYVLIQGSSLLIVLTDDFRSWQSLAAVLLVFSDWLYFSGILYSKITILHMNIFLLHIICNYCAFGIVNKIWRGSFIFDSKAPNPEIEFGMSDHGKSVPIISDIVTEILENDSDEMQRDYKLGDQTPRTSTITRHEVKDFSVINN